MSLINSAKKAVILKLNDTVFLTFIFSIIILNWKPIYYLLFSIDDPDHKIFYIENEFSDYTIYNLIIAIVITLIYGFGYPLLLIGFNTVKNLYLIKEEENKAKLLEKVKLSNEAEFKADLARAGTQTVEELESSIKEKNIRIEELQKSISKINLDSQVKISDYEKTINEINESNLNFTKEINNLNRENNLIKEQNLILESSIIDYRSTLNSINIKLFDEFPAAFDILYGNILEIFSKDIEDKNFYFNSMENAKIEMALLEYFRGDSKMNGLSNNSKEILIEHFNIKDFSKLNNRFSNTLFLYRLKWLSDFIRDTESIFK